MFCRYLFVCFTLPTSQKTPCTWIVVFYVKPGLVHSNLSQVLEFLVVFRVKDGEWTVEQLEKERELLHRRKQDQGRRERELKEENLCNQVSPSLFPLHIYIVL